MALALLTTRRPSKKDVRRARRQGKDLDRLEAIVDLLQAEAGLPARCRLHRLHGDWAGHCDCHVAPDWILLYRVTEKELVLVRTGSHSELFQ
jgi:mRNA interferase YafQ